MTVCIAALYENGKGAVLASDHMITASIPIGYEFENDETSKIHALNDDTYVLSAGNVLFGDQIVQSSRITIAGEGLEHVRDMAVVIKNKYQTFRLSHIEDNYLAPRGLTLEEYHGRQATLHSAIVQMIDEAMVNVDIGVELILVGPAGAGYSIYVITNPGMAHCMDAIGFCAIGSGAPHVTYSLLGAKYKKSLGKSDVEDLVMQAKKISEVAPGVGKETSDKVLPKEE